MWKILRDPIGAIGGGVVGAAKGLGRSAVDTSGFSPLASTLSSGGSLFGSRGGRGRGAGRGGGSSKSETGLLNTSLLFQIRDEVQQIKGLLVATAIPESERREKEFDEARRHRELLAAISGLTGGIGGGLTGKKDGGSLAKLLLGLLALTGLAMLPKLLEMVPGIVDGIQSFLDKMGLFLTAMLGVFLGLSKRTKGMKPPKSVVTRVSKKGLTKAEYMKRENERRRLTAEKVERRRVAREAGRSRVTPTTKTTTTTRNVRVPPRAERFPRFPMVSASPPTATRVADPRAGRSFNSQRMAGAASPTPSATRFRELGSGKTGPTLLGLNEKVARLENAQKKTAETRARMVMSADDAKRRATKATEVDKQRIARQQFRATMDPSQRRIDQAHRSNPKVLRNVMETRLKNLGTNIADRFKVMDAVINEKVQHVRNFVETKFRFGRNFANVRFVAVQRGLTNLQENFQRSGLRTASQNMFRGGVSMKGVSIPAPTVAGVPKTPPKVTSGAPKTPVGSGRGNWGSRAWAAGLKWKDLGRIGRGKVEHVLGSRMFRWGGRIMGGFAIGWVALKEYQFYYENTYVPEMEKIKGTTMSHKGRTVAQFDPHNTKVKQARKKLWEEIMRLVPVLVFAMGLGFLGAAVGSWTGAMISVFVTVITGGIGGAMAPLIMLAGGIAGGVFGFVKGMELAHTELGQQASKALAPNFAQNEEVMKWIDIVYRGMIGIENQVMVGFRGTADQLVAVGDKMQGESFRAGATVLSKASGVAISTAGRLMQGFDYGRQAVAAVPKVFNAAVNAAVGVNAQQDSREALAKRKGFSSFADYEKSSPQERREALATLNAREKPKVIPKEKLMSIDKRKAVLSMMTSARDKSIAFLAKNPNYSGAAKMIKFQNEAQRAIENLINAPLHESGNIIVNHQEIKDARRNTTTVQQSSSVITNQGYSLAFGLPGSGRF